MRTRCKRLFDAGEGTVVESEQLRGYPRAAFSGPAHGVVRYTQPIHNMNTHLLRFPSLVPALALVLLAPTALPASEASARADAAISEARGDTAQSAMKELDVEIDRLDALVSNAPTAQEKAAAEARLDVLKNRRSELRKTYVKSRYDELKADVRAEANRLGAWTKRTFTRDPVARTDDKITDSVSDAKRDVRAAGDSAYAGVSTAGAAMDLAAYKLRPTDTNKEEAKAALKALDHRIEELDDRADKMPRGAERDAAKRRVKALEDRKDELKHDFNKARFDALIDSVQAEWNDLRH